MKVSKQETITMMGATVIVIFLLLYMYMGHFREETKLLQCEYYAQGVMDEMRHLSAHDLEAAVKEPSDNGKAMKSDELQVHSLENTSGLATSNDSNGGVYARYLKRFKSLSPASREKAEEAFGRCIKEL